MVVVVSNSSSSRSRALCVPLVVVVVFTELAPVLIVCCITTQTDFYVYYNRYKESVTQLLDRLSVYSGEPNPPFACSTFFKPQNCGLSTPCVNDAIFWTKSVSCLVIGRVILNLKIYKGIK